MVNQASMVLGDTGERFDNPLLLKTKRASAFAKGLERDVNDLLAASCCKLIHFHVSLGRTQAID